MSNNSWKPDFTKKDPWEDVPDDYAGVATFVPTASNPLPPWTGQLGSEVLPTYGTQEYEMLAQRIMDQALLTSQTGTAAEKEQANIVLAAGKKAQLARFESGLTSTAVTALGAEKQPSWVLPLGILAVAAVIFLVRR